MNVSLLDYSSAEDFVSESKSSDLEVNWEGWDILIWRSYPGGYGRTDGAFKNGKWGLQTRIAPDNLGLWRVPKRYVKNS